MKRDPGHVVVAGAGVVGLSVAYYCALNGLRVTVVERNPARRDGCSFGNAGMVVPSHFTPLAAPGMVALGLKWMWNPESPFYIKPRLDWNLFRWGLGFWRAASAGRVERAAPVLRDLHMQSRARFVELRNAGLDFPFESKGLFMLCKSHATLEEEAGVARKAAELGIPARVLDADETARLNPGARLDVEGSVYFPLDCHLSPEGYIECITTELRRLGVDLRWNTPLTAVETSGDKISAVRSGDHTIRGDEFVLCSGIWSAELAAKLGLRLPMQAGKGYSLTLSNPRQLPSVCGILTEARVAITPMGGSLRVGGTMELCGTDERVSPHRVRGIIRAIPRYFPEFTESDFEGIEPWCGLRPCPPDGLPYLGPSGRFSNLTVATGHSMMGLSLAPETGRIVSAILTGEDPGVDLALLSPDRYA